MMKKIKFLIKYSSELEIQRALTIKRKLKWYFDNGYNLSNSVLPKNISVEELDKKSEKEIIECVNEEYKEEIFKPHEQAVNSLLPEYLNKLADYFFEINLEVLLNIEIRLTKYGTTGSYNVPNVAIVNISKSFNIGLIRTILHETIHLHIQNLIDKYKIGQWEKEIIVDCLFEKFSIDILKKQNYPIDASKIKEIFEENYPNIELIIRDISK
ncbi:MAG: hypothetical protein AAB623_02780 [Patescibacteria group bacterium]